MGKFCRKCGKYVGENTLVCPWCKTNIDKDNVELHVPLDYSILKMIIPADDEILYSSACKGIAKEAGSTFKWSGHLLITSEGMAYTKPHKGESPLKYYYPWWDKIELKKNSVLTDAGTIAPSHEPEYETKEQFDDRIQEFGEKIRPLMEQKQKEWISKFSNKKLRKREEKRIKKEFSLIRKEYS